MPIIDLSTADDQRLRLVAAALGVTPAAAVGVLLDRLAQQSVVAASAAANDGAVPIHVVYRGTRIEAEFDPATKGVTITSAPLAGKRFNSPSRAAIEVVRTLNPSVHPNRNGWGFWVVTETGQELQSIR